MTHPECLLLPQTTKDFLINPNSLFIVVLNVWQPIKMTNVKKKPSQHKQLIVFSYQAGQTLKRRLFFFPLLERGKFNK